MFEFEEESLKTDYFGILKEDKQRKASYGSGDKAKMSGRGK